MYHFATQPIVRVGVYSLLLTLLSCGTPEPPASKLTTPELARLHCGGCHLYPAPTLLDKTTWRNGVLPKMKFMLGFRTQVPDSVLAYFREGDLGTSLIDAAGLYPREPVLATADWQRLYDWYLEQAPDRLPATSQVESIDTLLGFTVRVPQERYSPPGTSMVRFLAPGKLMTADLQKNLVIQWNNQLLAVKKAPLPSGAVGMNAEADALWLTSIGNFIASDRRDGFLTRYPADPTSPPSQPIEQLRRPVHAAFGDLNADGRTDVVICEFGKWLGGLSWWENTGAGYRRHDIRATAGATQAFIEDMNADGRPDVVALFAQAREGISIFYNDGDGRFREDAVLQFPPTWGSTSLRLVDYNNDGHLDILYTCGDNADYQPVVKPYHGVYLYRNDKTNQFEQTYFHHLPGAYGARAADFDRDGDLDLAAVAYFPDYAQPGTPGFVFLRQDDPLRFTPHTFAGHRRGRWVNLDVADFDGDGDEDIVLGSLAMEIDDPAYRGIQSRWLEEGIPWVLLENTQN